MSTRTTLSKQLRKIASDIQNLLVEYQKIREEKIAIVHDPNLLFVGTGERNIGIKCEECRYVSYISSDKLEIPLTKILERRECPICKSKKLKLTIYPVEGSKNPEIINPVLRALMKLKEIDISEAHERGVKWKVDVLEGMGITKYLECSALINWVNKLSPLLTYLLEMRLVYSEEVKAKFQELLADLETGKGYASRLYKTLLDQYGVLSNKQYHELVGKTIHYAQIAMKTAHQIADYHEEFMARGYATPTTWGEGVEWILEVKEEERRRKGE